MDLQMEYFQIHLMLQYCFHHHPHQIHHSNQLHYFHHRRHQQM
jgi:hypothetical protein